MDLFFGRFRILFAHGGGPGLRTEVWTLFRLRAVDLFVLSLFPRDKASAADASCYFKIGSFVALPEGPGHRVGLSLLHASP